MSHEKPMVKIIATGTRVPYPGLPPLVGTGEEARRAPHRYVTKDAPAEVSLSDDQEYWGRRLVKNEVALVESEVALVENAKPKSKPTTKAKDKDK